MLDIKTPFEAKRLCFLNAFKKQKIINMIVLVAALAVIIVIMVVFSKQMEYALVGAVVVIIGLFCYTHVNKKALNRRTMEFIKQFYEITSSAALKHAGINDFVQIADGIIERSEVEKAELMSGITHVKSRNVIDFKLNNREVKISDLLFKVGVDHKTSKVAFCGKFLQCKLETPVDKKTLIYRKPKAEFVGPNMLEGLEQLKDDEKIIVYSADSKFAIEHKNLLSAISKIEVDDTLLDLTFSITGDTLTVALSYADTIMVVPLYDEIKEKPFEKYAIDLKDILDIIEKI